MRSCDTPRSARGQLGSMTGFGEQTWLRRGRGLFRFARLTSRIRLYSTAAGPAPRERARRRGLPGPYSR
jgi:hypothetical protein